MAVLAHARRGRVFIAAIDGGQIAQPESAAVKAQRQGRRSSRRSNWPLMRIWMSSPGVRSTPAYSTAFCWLMALITCRMSRFMLASFFCETSM
jgi:hypothetical protein